jgi:hypothetical protein
MRKRSSLWMSSRIGAVTRVAPPPLELLKRGTYHDEVKVSDGLEQLTRGRIAAAR